MNKLPEGTVAVVTGAGQGIGAAVARALRESGATMVLAGRTAATLEAVAEELGGDTLPVVTDVTDPAAVARLADTVRARLGDVGVLVNNAGASLAAPLHKLSLNDWNRMLAVNATGTFLVTQAFHSGMVHRGWGRIVNIASVAGLSGGKYISAYAAAKHAVIGFTRSIAAEVADKGVTVNAVCPGFVATPMTDASVANIMAKTGRSREAALEAILATTPQHRLIEPEEVAHAVMALVDQAAKGINGQALVLDGGALLA